MLFDPPFQAQINFIVESVSLKSSKLCILACQSAIIARPYHNNLAAVLPPLTGLILPASPFHFKGMSITACRAATSDQEGRLEEGQESDLQSLYLLASMKIRLLMSRTVVFQSRVQTCTPTRRSFFWSMMPQCCRKSCNLCK